MEAADQHPPIGTQRERYAYERHTGHGQAAERCPLVGHLEHLDLLAGWPSDQAEPIAPSRPSGLAKAAT